MQGGRLLAAHEPTQSWTFSASAQILFKSHHRLQLISCPGSNASATHPSYSRCPGTTLSQSQIYRH
eukprot:760714-Hanusia_phi.AAC.2